VSANYRCCKLRARLCGLPLRRVAGLRDGGEAAPCERRALSWRVVAAPKPPDSGGKVSTGHPM